MYRSILSGLFLLATAACGGGETEVQKPSSPEAGVTESASAEPAGERGAIIAACQRFETKAACNCIADQMAETLDAAQFKQVSEIMGGGTIMPDAIKAKLGQADAVAFDRAMTAWNDKCELS